MTDNLVDRGGRVLVGKRVPARDCERRDAARIDEPIEVDAATDVQQMPGPLDVGVVEGTRIACPQAIIGGGVKDAPHTADRVGE